MKKVFPILIVLCLLMFIAVGYYSLITVSANFAKNASKSEKVLYDFENGTEGFNSDSKNITLSTSNDIFYTGKKSLLARISTTSNSEFIKVENPNVKIGDKVKLYVYIDSLRGLKGIQPYALDKNWKWVGCSYSLSQLKEKMWNELSFEIDGTKGLDKKIVRLGIELMVENSFNSTLRIDTITVETCSDNNNENNFEDKNTKDNSKNESKSYDRYFKNENIPLEEMKLMSLDISKSQAKSIIKNQVEEHWQIIEDTFNFKSKDKASAFFIGLATFQSTLNAAQEAKNSIDGTNSYGLLLVSETAYNNGSKPLEDKVDMNLFDNKPQNLYDPCTSTHMGIRLFVSYGKELMSNNLKGEDLLKQVLIKYLSESNEKASNEFVADYADEVAAYTDWYINGNHLADEQFCSKEIKTSVDNPWLWYNLSE